MKSFIRRTILLFVAVVATCTAEMSAQLNKEYFFYMGQNFLVDSRYKEAIETINILLNVDKTPYEAYFLRGIAKYNLDDLLGAEQDFTTAIERNPVFTTAYQYRAITRSRLGNYDDALNDFREAIELRPDRPEPYYSRGVTYLLSQQFEKAVTDFDTFIRYNDKVADAYINRGTSYLYMKDTTAAYDNFDLAIRTNRDYPEGYLRRGTLLMSQQKYNDALNDFNMAIERDTSYVIPLFNRALVYDNLNRPVQAIEDFDRVLELDPRSSLTYFNRAIVRTQIGDYNRALEDYDKVVELSPANVLVYYNRALLLTRLGEFEDALGDYNKAIELYPDFANAYLNRASIRYFLRDEQGAQKDNDIAEQKIAEYRSRLNDSTLSIYADTSRNFNQLLAFDSKFSGNTFEKSTDNNRNVILRPMFRFSIVRRAPETVSKLGNYFMPKVDEFVDSLDNSMFALTCEESNVAADTLIMLENRYDGTDWMSSFKRGMAQTLIRQYTSAVASFTAAIEANPTNPFLYLNRATARAEMIDFISSIDNSYQRITIETGARLHNNSTRTYNYDEAIADLNKAAKLLPEFAHTYYNRANLHVLSGQFPEAFDDYTKAIELNGAFAEAYFNRGLVQIYMNDTKKGCLDISKAGELGIEDAYDVLRKYTKND